MATCENHEHLSKSCNEDTETDAEDAETTELSKPPTVFSLVDPSAAAPGDVGGGLLPGGTRFEALDATRWIASAQIVYVHFYDSSGRGAASSWTQFFFLLSGFVLAYAEMSKPPPKPGHEVSLLAYVRKRLVATYPSYLFALILFFFAASEVPSFAVAVLPLHVLLVQSWLPLYNKHAGFGALQWNGEAWFMSTLLFYWLFLQPLARCVRQMSLGLCCLVLAACWACSVLWLLAFFLIFHGDVENTRGQLVIHMHHMSPWGYFHVFIAGVVSARLFILSSMHDADTKGPIHAGSRRLAVDAGRVPFVVRHGCCLGYGAFAALAVLVPWSDAVYACFHNGGLLPVMILVVIGAAAEMDLLAVWIFKSKLFKLLGRISYNQYLMQRLIWSRLVGVFAIQQLQIVFPVVLLFWAYFCQSFVEGALTEWQRWREEKGIKGTSEALVDWLDQKVSANAFRTMAAILALCLLIVEVVVIALQLTV